MLLPKQNRVRDEKHRRWVAENLPCAVSGVWGRTQAAHISSGRASMGMKQSDKFIIPLSVEQHAVQHNFAGGEIAYWEQYGGIEKAKELSNALFVLTGQTDRALELLARFRR